MRAPNRILLAALLCGLGTVLPTAGQDRAGAAGPFDEQLLYGLYETDAAPLRAALRVVDVTAYPLFAAVPAAAIGYAFTADVPGARAAAYRLTVSEGAALAGAMVLKHVYDRPRPYATRDDVSSRAVGLDRFLLEHDPQSFPSAHAALAFAIATSLSLSYPEWYVVAPAFVWAVAVAASRVWLGVHYPTDVLAGALLGASAGAGVHLLRAHITPAWARRPGGPHAALRIALDL